MWTVTLLLKPAIVTAHLLGGMLTLALFVWTCSFRSAWPTSRSASRSRSPQLATPAQRFCSLRSSC